jgi:hypothetical protein
MKYFQGQQLSQNDKWRFRPSRILNMQYKALPKAGLVLQLNFVGKLTKYTTSDTLKGGIVLGLPSKKSATR